MGRLHGGLRRRVRRDQHQARLPWYVTPSNHKWFRNLAVAQIVAATLEDLGMKMPQPHVDLAAIRKQYHQAAEKESKGEKKEKREKQ